MALLCEHCFLSSEWQEPSKWLVSEPWALSPHLPFSQAHGSSHIIHSCSWHLEAIPQARWKCSSEPGETPGFMGLDPGWEAAGGSVSSWKLVVKDLLSQRRISCFRSKERGWVLSRAPLPPPPNFVFRWISWADKNCFYRWLFFCKHSGILRACPVFIDIHILLGWAINSFSNSQLM